MHNSQTQKD